MLLEYYIQCATAACGEISKDQAGLAFVRQKDKLVSNGVLKGCV